MQQSPAVRRPRRGRRLLALAAVTAAVVGTGGTATAAEAAPSPLTRADVRTSLPVVGDAAPLAAPRLATVEVDGSSRTVLSAAPTVRDLLADLDVLLVDGDAVHLRDVTDEAGHRVGVPLDAWLAPGQTFVVTRVRGHVETREALVPAGRQTVEDADRPVGTSEVVREGVDGVVAREVAVRVVDGQVAEEAVLAETVVREPTPERVVVGTRRPEPPAPRPQPSTPAARSTPAPSAPAPAAPSSSGGLNWAALAACESGGDPRATNPSGKYRGLYQFDLATWRSVGGTGDPAAASVAEQTRRAQILFDRRGRSPWPECGRRL